MRAFVSAAALFVMTVSAEAAPVSYVFDSLTKLDMHRSQPTVTGILQGATTPTTVVIYNEADGGYAHSFSRCIPVILTMLEKPGRYLLHITTDSDPIPRAFLSCGLEVRN